MRRVALSIIFSLFLIVSLVAVDEGVGSWRTYSGNSQRSNYIERAGNITYPIIKNYSIENYFTGIPGPVMLVGDVNQDPFLEIVAISEKTNTLYVFDHNLSLLWSFKVSNPPLSEEKYSEWNKVSSLALGDIDGDGDDEILFSMCEDRSNQTILHAFNGDGKELWDRTFLGRITKQGILMDDLNNDGRKEIIVGSSNIYILNGEGDILSVRELKFDEYTGVSEIALKDNKLLASIWHYSSQDLERYSLSGEQSYGTDRVWYSFLNLALFRIGENLSLEPVWQHEMEDSAAAYSDTYYNFYVSPSFEIAFFIHHNGIKKIYVNNGSMKEIAKWNVPMGVYCSIGNESSYWTYSTSIFSLCAEDNCPTWMKNYTQSYSNLFHGILVFDVNNDGIQEIIAAKGSDIVFFNANNGDEILETNIFAKETMFTPEVLLHADTDNDGFDEIITTDPEGRIVIIDNGTPPKPQESGISMETMAIAGIGAIITTSAIIWLWRKRR